jgi:lysine/ornithine N-monooxygenase
LIVLKEGNKIIKDQAQVAEIFNAYYTKETESESPTIAVDLSSLRTKAENLPRLTLHKTNATEVREVMQGMNVNKATGYEQKWGISQD